MLSQQQNETKCCAGCYYLNAQRICFSKKSLYFDRFRDLKDTCMCWETKRKGVAK